MENLNNLINTLCGQDQADAYRPDATDKDRCYLKEPYFEVDFGLNLFLVRICIFYQIMNMRDRSRLDTNDDVT